MLERRLVGHNETEIAGLLGQDFAAALAEVPQGRWAGPLESAYGLHLVYVESREPARVPPLSEIRDRVLAEYVAERQREANEAIYQALKARYEIVVEAGAGGADLSARLP
jgi:parvulin-like peptidyl-prolyl isomerase